MRGPLRAYEADSTPTHQNQKTPPTPKPKTQTEGLLVGPTNAPFPADRGGGESTTRRFTLPTNRSREGNRLALGPRLKKRGTLLTYQAHRLRLEKGR